MAAARIGIEVAPDEAEVGNAPLELRDRALHVRLWALRQHAHADEGFGKQADDPSDQVIAPPRPVARDGFVADVRRHGGGAGEKIVTSAPRSLIRRNLVGLDRLANLVVRNLGVGRAAWCPP